MDKTTSVQAERKALQILNNELPFIPIYFHPVSFLKSVHVCGFIDDVDRENEFLMDVEQLRVGEDCAIIE